MLLLVRADHDGFAKLHHRPDGKRIGLKSMQEIMLIFQLLGLSCFNGQQVLLEQSVRQILNFERERPIVIPLPQGMTRYLLRTVSHVLARGIQLRHQMR